MDPRSRQRDPTSSQPPQHLWQHECPDRLHRRRHPGRERHVPDFRERSWTVHPRLLHDWWRAPAHAGRSRHITPTPTTYERSIFLPDIHAPFVDHDALAVALAFVRHFQPDVVFLIGDVVDM